MWASGLAFAMTIAAIFFVAIRGLLTVDVEAVQLVAFVPFLAVLIPTRYGAGAFVLFSIGLVARDPYALLASMAFTFRIGVRTLLGLRTGVLPDPDAPALPRAITRA